MPCSSRTLREPRSSTSCARAASSSSRPPRTPSRRACSAATVARCCSASTPTASRSAAARRAWRASSARTCCASTSEQFGADRLTLVFAGDFDPDALRAAVSRAFASWRRAERAARAAAGDASACSGRRVLLIDAPGCDADLLLDRQCRGGAQLSRSAPRSSSPTTAFGGSFGSMLMQALRVRSGLTYSVHSGFHRGSVAGEFAISSFTQTESTARALRHRAADAR